MHNKNSVWSLNSELERTKLGHADGKLVTAAVPNSSSLVLTKFESES